MTVTTRVRAEPGSVRRRGRPANVDTADTVRALLNAARREFAAHGFAATSNRSVAARAGLAHTAIYNHFGSKARLFHAVFVDVQDLLVAELEGSATAVATSDEPALPRALVDALGALGSADPSYVEFLASMYVEVRRHVELHGLFQGRPPFPILDTLRGLVGAGGSTDDELWFWVTVALGLAQLSTLAPPATVVAAIAGLQRCSAGMLPTGQACP